MSGTGTGGGGDDRPIADGVDRRELLRRGAIIGGTLVWASPVIHSFQPALAAAGSPPPDEPPEIVQRTALFLVLDEDAIDNHTRPGLTPSVFSESDVNDDIAGKDQRSVLRYFADPANVGQEIDIYGGQTGDEGWFALKTVPASWPNLAALLAATVSQDNLDKVPDVTPLRTAGLQMLVDEQAVVGALVHDSDISINYGPLNGSLKGSWLGLVAFQVLSLSNLDGGSSSTLPVVRVRILDPSAVFDPDTVWELFTNAPVPVSSSVPAI